MSKRGQAYRLDWQGTAQTVEDVNRRSKKLWIDTDEMIQTLFHRLKDAEDLIATLEEEVAALQVLNTSSTSGTQIVIQEQPVMDDDPLWMFPTSATGSGGSTTNVRDAGYWTPWIVDVDGAGNAEFILTDGGDVIAVWTPTS